MALVLNYPPAGYELMPADTSARADFEKPVIDGIIQMYGEFVTWQKTALCSCRANAQTDQPNPLCPVCRGRGEELYDPQLIRAVFERPDYDVKRLLAQGEWWGGQGTATVLAETAVGFRHRLTMRDAVIEFSERRERVGTVQALRYAVAARTVTYRRIVDWQPLTMVYRVLRLTWFSAPTTQVALDEGIDFAITKDGEVDWAPGVARGTAPPVGTLFAVTYMIHPVWVVTSLSPYPMQNTWTESGVPVPTRLNLPTSLRVQLEYLQEG